MDFQSFGGGGGGGKAASSSASSTSGNYFGGGESNAYGPLVIVALVLFGFLGLVLIAKR